MRKYVWIVMIICLGAPSCTSSAAKKKPIEINRMKLIMWDLIKAGEWHLQILAKDSTLRNKKQDIRLYEQVFVIHGITKDAYFRSYKYYEAHPVEFKILIDSLDNFSNHEKNKLQNHGQTR